MDSNIVGFLNIIELYINNDPECVIIVDSVSSMVPKDELEGLIRTGVRNALPRLLSMFLQTGALTIMKICKVVVVYHVPLPTLHGLFDSP